MYDTARTLQNVSMSSCDDGAADNIAQGMSAMTALTILEVSRVQGAGLLALAHELAALSPCLCGNARLAMVVQRRWQRRCRSSGGSRVCPWAIAISIVTALYASVGLQQLTALRIIYLSRNKVDDAAGRALVVCAAGLPQLQSLDLTFNGVV